MASKTHKTWQEELIGECSIPVAAFQFNFVLTYAAECRRRRLPEPVFHVLSDRRGRLCSVTSLYTVLTMSQVVVQLGRQLLL
jgi:hypothetical protein